jgi:predicted nucleic acid-binding protein
MKLVIDSNRIMAGLIKDSLTRKIIFDEEFDFIAPDYILTEIDRHRQYLIDDL